MTIPNFRIHPYGFIIVLSIIIGMIYIYRLLKKEKIENNFILLFFIMYVIFGFLIGKVFSIIASPENEVTGLSAYGGLIGVVSASIIFECIKPFQKKIIKSTILSLPLTYSLAKIACFISGCCYGIPYNGPFSVTYTGGLNIPLFPVQITETICFGVLFFFINKNREKPNIVYTTIISGALLKFSLDFLRYEHINKIFTVNQVFSIILVIGTILYIMIKKSLKKT